MTGIAYTASKEMIGRFGVNRHETQKKFGQAKYQELISKYIPIIRQTMSERDCDAIIAAVYLMVGFEASQSEKNLVACAGYDLARAS